MRRLTKDNSEEIYGLCRGNPLYYSYCPPFVTRESIKEDFSVLPPGKELSDKYFLGWVSGNPQAEHFWHKNHFSETGTVVHSDVYMVTVAERRL